MLPTSCSSSQSVSKKVYKRAVGDLYRRRLITIHDDGIHLIVSD